MSDNGHRMTQHRRALLIEDDPDIRNLLVILCRHALPDLDLETEQDGKAALRRLAGDERFDLVITDMMMPELDGAAVARHLAEDGGDQSPPVVILSGLSEDRLAGVLALPNVIGYFRKPLDPMLLADQLRGVLDRVAPLETPSG